MKNFGVTLFLLWLNIAFSQINPLAPKDSFLGTFKNEQLTLELQGNPGNPGQYVGTILFGGQKFPVQARKTNDVLMEGAFQSQGHEFPFTASLQNQALSFSTGGATYTLIKEMPVNHLTQPPQNPLNPLNPPNPLNPTSDPSTSPKTGKIYRHPLGFTFVYPETWAVQEGQGGLMLTPPDLKTNAYGPTEVYFIFGEPANGISQPDDPRVIQYLQQSLMAIAPFLQYTGKPETLSLKNQKGVKLTWEGQNPMGAKVRAWVFVVIFKDFAIALTALGETQYLNPRENTVKEIFSSFSIEAPERDPKFIATWRTTYTHTSNTPTNDFNMASDRFMILKSDGTFVAGGQAILSSGQKHSDGSQTSTSLDTGTKLDEQGQWGSRGNRLYLIWKDGRYVEYQCELAGQVGARHLLLTNPDGKKQLWEEVR